MKIKKSLDDHLFRQWDYLTLGWFFDNMGFVREWNSKVVLNIGNGFYLNINPVLAGRE